VDENEISEECSRRIRDTDHTTSGNRMALSQKIRVCFPVEMRESGNHLDFNFSSLDYTDHRAHPWHCPGTILWYHVSDCRAERSLPNSRPTTGGVCDNDDKYEKW